jgi:hypothetical protein
MAGVEELKPWMKMLHLKSGDANINNGIKVNLRYLPGKTYCEEIIGIL